jgi:Ca2+-binding EF-hand superfamily protein
MMASPYGGFAYGAGRRIVQPRYTIGQYAQKGYEARHSGYEARHVTDEKLNNLKEVRAACGLQHIPVATGLQTFKATAQDGKLSKDLFQQSYVDLLAAHGVSAPSEAVCVAVFDLFDRDQNGVVDMMELVCGISLLCQGTEDDKIAAVFKAFDEDGDGFVSMEEMNTFLLSVFRVVLTPAVAGIMRAQGVEVDSAEDLAAVTTEECFKDADLNHDGRLSIDEFRKWFYEPSTDPSLVFSPIKNIFH